MITYNYTPDKTVTTSLKDGTAVTTTFNRLIPTGIGNEYEAFYVVQDEDGEQATSNGVLILTPEQFGSL